MIRNFFRQVRTPNADVRRGVIRSTLFAGAMLLVSCRGGVEADDVDTAVSASGRFVPVVATATTSVVKAAPAAPSMFGINLASPLYFSGEQIFTNLLIGAEWVTSSWATASDTSFDQAGNVVQLPAGGLQKILVPPNAVIAGKGATVRCTWTGTGKVDLGGVKGGDVVGDHSWEFRWSDPAGRVWLTLSTMSATDPVRNVDCREKGTTGLFSPDYIAYLKPFGVLRFMDWMQTNNNAPARWSTRVLPTDFQQGVRGAALENIIALSNEVGADAWVNVPWNSDDDYVLRMAKMLHDGIPATRHIYVEVSNEVWNGQFAAQHQAETEGLAEKLSTSPYEASLFRYSEKTTQVMKIWTQVFADRPGQLIRIAGAQHFNPANARVILSYGDTAKWVDALATAPYFGFDLYNDDMANVTDPDVLFPVLTAKAKSTVQQYGGELQALAKEYGKRLIAYEAGQHIMPKDGSPDLLIKLNRDPRMYDVYRTYLATWKAQVNDTMVLFSATGSFGQFGAWGLREYAGQPIDQTPKLRATLDTIAGK